MYVSKYPPTGLSAGKHLLRFCTKGLFDRTLLQNMDQQTYGIWLAGSMCVYLFAFALTATVGLLLPHMWQTYAACGACALIGMHVYRMGVYVHETVCGASLLLIGVALPYGVLIAHYGLQLPGLLAPLAASSGLMIVACLEPKSAHCVWRCAPSTIAWPTLGISTALAICWIAELKDPLHWAWLCLTAVYALTVFSFALKSAPHMTAVADALGATILLLLWVAFMVLQLAAAILFSVLRLATWPIRAAAVWIARPRTSNNYSFAPR